MAGPRSFCGGFRKIWEWLEPTGVSELVGSTPIVELTGLLREDAALGVKLFGELEAFSPGGAVEDQAGVSMIEAAQRDGLIEPGCTVVVGASSGNAGIALGFVCAVKGQRLRTFLTQGMRVVSARRRRACTAPQAEVVESTGGINEAKRSTPQGRRG